jgi:hypothetical protein
MGRPTRQLAYDAGTNTLSGVAPHNQVVRVHVAAAGAAMGARLASKTVDLSTRASTLNGAWSLVLTGLAAGTYDASVSVGGTSMSAPLRITKP